MRCLEYAVEHFFASTVLVKKRTNGGGVVRKAKVSLFVTSREFPESFEFLVIFNRAFVRSQFVAYCDASQFSFTEIELFRIYIHGYDRASR